MVKPAPADRTFEAFFTNSFDAAFVLDHDSVFVRVNPAATRLLGYAAEEIEGQPLTIILPPEVRSEHDSLVGSYLADRGASAVLGKARRFDVIDNSGQRIPVELKAFELDPDGRNTGFGAVMVDMRARLELEAERDATIARLERLADTDELTSLPNRRASLTALQRARAPARRGVHPASVAILDIDFFKRVNDTLGHAAGDAVLRDIAQLVQGSLRDSDLVGRIGGEEFGLLLDYSTADDAVNAAERVRQKVADTTFDTGGTGPVRITVSIGIALLAHDVPVDVALKGADRALYRAKENGRNRVELDQATSKVQAAQKKPTTT